jgi:hypothetical protein
MAIQIEANYSKKVGLPAFSSHQFSITIKTEINDLSQVEAESARLYALLQTSVDRELQQTGYVVSQGGDTVVQPNTQQVNGNGSNGHSTNNGHSSGYQHRNGHHRNNNGYNHRQQRNGYRNHQNNGHSSGFESEWNCSVKQKELILRIVQENNLDKREIEDLSQQLFSKGVKYLNKLEASGLIDELLRRYDNEPATTGGAR